MKNSVFDYENYRHFLKDWVKSRSRNGRGQMSAIAKYLNTSTVSVSYIFNGSRNLTEEQCLDLGDYLGLNENEADYFLLLVRHARAGSHKLEQKIRQQLLQLSIEAQKVKSRVPRHHELAKAEQEKFYSNWYYSAVRLLTSIEGYQSTDAIADSLRLPRTRAREVIDFLVNCGLCAGQDGSLRMGPQRTHIDAKSALVSRHHTNWRLKAIESVDTIRDDELFFTGPMTISEQTFSEIRSELVDLIARITKMVEPSKSEILACVNFDLFRVLR